MNETQISEFLDKVVPLFTLEGIQRRGFNIISFAIAQACIESNYGSSGGNNILGIVPGAEFNSWNECVEAYYSQTALGKSEKAKKAETIHQYYNEFLVQAYCKEPERYYNTIKSIINVHKLDQYDGADES